MNERGPTPETRAKAREGVVGILSRRKERGSPFLWPEHISAAELIEEAHSLINDDVGWSLMNFDGVGREPTRPPTADLPSTLRKIVIQHNDWVDELTRRKLRLLFAITMEIVVEGRGLGATERRYGLETGEAKRMLRSALDVYCYAAGWPCIEKALDRAGGGVLDNARGVAS